MSATGSIIKKRIAKAILDQIRWSDWEWLWPNIPGYGNVKILDLEVHPVDDTTTSIRIKTAQQGTIWFTIKVSENY